MKEVASIIGAALRSPADETTKTACRSRVAELMGRFPAYPD
jgi:glycine/serine hydroxymethyltransferase